MEDNKLAQMASGYAEQDNDVCVDVMQITRHRALKHVLIGDELYFRTLEGLLLRCLGPSEALGVMNDVHEGECCGGTALLNLD